MSVQLSDELVSLLHDRESIKLLATTDESGTPHVVAKDYIHIAEDGTIHYLEHLESSRTNHNLVRAIWFDRRVSIVIIGTHQSFQIKGRPLEVHITGPLFQKHYAEVRHRLGDVDLSGVWVIEPLEVINENPEIRRQEEEKRRPFFRHLDRLAKPLKGI